ncbi:MAG: hypothetical protein HC819_16975 [Cyclobacteriaceae bacterium]|nr:hypothetical protein [Cyclobacteriaceae bacterium]
MKIALKISLIYVIFSVCYIIVSDVWVFNHFLAHAPTHKLEQIQIIKGIVFVLASGLLLFSVTYDAIRKLETATLKRRVFKRLSQRIISALPEGVGLFDANGDLIIYNYTLRQQFSIPQRAANNPTLQNFSLTKLQEMLVDCDLNKRSNNEEIFQTSDKRWLNIKLSKLDMSASGKFTLLRCEDITDSKIAQMELLYDKKEFLAILEEVPFGILLFDIHGCLKFSNSVSALLIPHLNGSFLLSQLPDKIFDADRHEFQILLERAVRTNTSMNCRCRLNNKNLSGKWYQFDLLPVKAEENNGFLLICRDISVQVSNEEKQEHTSEELKKQVDKRTEEIERKNASLEESQKTLKNLLCDVQRIRDELIKSNAKLAEANKELEAFSYSVSHDLRAPLRTICGFSQALTEDYAQSIDPTGLDYLHRIQQGTVKMTNLIDDMLKLSRISRSAVEYAYINLNGLIEEIIIDLRKSYGAPEPNIEIQKDIWCEGDPRLVKILFTNLLDNAWKFTKNEKLAKISVGLENDEIFVKDNGVGFDEKYISKIYEPFQRLHDPGEFKGTGLGLAIVKRIVDRHQGEIRVSSVVNKGTTFYLKFPKSQQALRDN